jgi:PKD repeat protein
MNILNKIANRIRHASGSKLLVGALFIAMTGVALTANFATSGSHASAATCDTNNILPCGYSTIGDFVSKYKANDKGDYPAIYSAFGLDPSEIDRLSKTAKMGVAYRDGTVKVDGKVVATDAVSLGREKKSYSTTVNIGGKTYYQDRDQDAFRSDIPALVMMNGDQFEFAALTACGNPVKGHPTGKAPEYSCNMLNVTQKNRTTFNYTTDVTALNGAKVAKLVYEFGDGTSQTVTSASQTVTHEYAKEGSFTTKVTVYVSVNGETKTVTGAKCAKPVEVKPVPETPAYACSALTPTTINKENRQYRFTAKTTQSGGATLKDVNFNFGDGQTVTGVKPSDASTAMSEHTYAKAGDYTIVATVNFNVAGNVKSVTCQTKISPEQTPPQECKPGIPVGDSRCTECKPGVPAGSKECTPQELPNTSAVSVLGGTIGGGSILTAGGYFLRSRRNLMSTFLRR